MNRHLYVIWLDPQEIVALFRVFDQPGHVSLPDLTACRHPGTGERFALPADARVVDATYSWDRGQIGLKIEHESFPEVHPGEQAPWLSLTEVVIRVEPARQETEDGPIIVELPK